MVLISIRRLLLDYIEVFDWLISIEGNWNTVTCHSSVEFASYSKEEWINTYDIDLKKNWHHYKDTIILCTIEFINPMDAIEFKIRFL